MTDPAPRALVTREQLQPLGQMLQKRGLEPVHVPLLALSPTHEPPPPGRPGLVLVTSAAAARFATELAGIAQNAFVLAVGPKTASALEAIGLPAAVVGEGGGVEIVEQVEAARREHGLVGSIWHVGARELSPGLDQALRSLAGPIRRWCVYQNDVPAGVDAALREALPASVLLFASGSAAAVFSAHAEPGDARVVVIGSATAEVARQVGLPVHAQAARPTLESLADAALEALSGRSGS